MFGETTISYVKIGNHPIETTIYKWLALGFQVPINLPSKIKKNLFKSMPYMDPRNSHAILWLRENLSWRAPARENPSER